MKRYILPIIIVSLGILISVGVFMLRDERAIGDVTDNSEQSNIGIGDPDNVRRPDSSDHLIGNPNAPIKIIEFSDMECPSCKVFHQTMIEVMEGYGKKGKVAWIYRHLPIDSIHSKSRTEAVAAECAGEIGGNLVFWEYVNKVFEITPSNNGLDLAILPKIAEDLGVDKEEFEECLSSGRHNERIENDFRDGVNAGAPGVPYSLALVRDDKILVIPGSQNSQVISFIIERELKQL